MIQDRENSDWTPLVANNRLVGPLPEIIDFTKTPFPEVDYSSEPSLYISEDSIIRKIIIPCDAAIIHFLCIKDLPSLEEIHLVGETAFFKTFQWIFIGGVPSLKKIALVGDVCSLEIKNAPKLSTLDLGGCSSLDCLKISNVPLSLDINVLGCNKLRFIIGLGDEYTNTRNISAQIAKNQNSSQRDGRLYSGMTFTDIDLVNDIINEGVKALSRKGLFVDSDDDSIMGRYHLAAYDPNFKPYAYRILEPLESVYTGGTGETYSYVFVQRYASLDDLTIEDVQGAGNSSPEDCLIYMLHWVRMGLCDDSSSDEQLLETLRDAAENTPILAIPDFPLRVSPSVDHSQKQLLTELAMKVGITVDDKGIGDYIYVYPDSGIPRQEMEILWGSSVHANMNMAIRQLTQLIKLISK